MYALSIAYVLARLVHGVELAAELAITLGLGQPLAAGELPLPVRSLVRDLDALEVPVGTEAFVVVLHHDLRQVA